MRAHGGHRDHPGSHRAPAAPGAPPRPGVVIVGDTPRPFFERYRDFAGIYDVWPRLDLLVYTPEEFERMRAEGRPFIEQVLAEGIVVHEAKADR